MHKCLPATMALALTLAADAGARGAQDVAAPALGRDTFAAQCTSILESEIGDLARRAAIAHPERHDVLNGQIHARRLAVELLGDGDRAGAAGSSAVIAGMCLFRGRAEIDDALARLLGQPGSAGDDASAAQAILHELAEHPPGETPLAGIELHRFDVALADRIAPVLAAVELLDQSAAEPAWVIVQRPEAPPTAGSIDDLDALGARIAAAPLPPETRDELLVIVAYLARGAAFADLRPSVERYRHALVALLDLTDAADAAAWMSEAARAELSARIHDAVVLFRDKASRHLGEQRMQRLVEAGPILAAFTSLQDAGRAPDLTAAQVTFAAQLIEDTADPAPAQWQRLGLALRRMVEYRALAEPDLATDLRVVRRQLEEAYRRAEEALAARAVDLLTARGGLADPALASVVADHQQYLEDLRRVGQLPRWIDQVRLIEPGAAGPFGGQLRTWSQNLLETARRPEATIALDRFERELAMFMPLPLETALRRGELAEPTGGRGDELAATVDLARQAWARGWGRGETAGPASVAMMRLQRLMEAIAATRDVVALGHGVLVLNRWAAWELDDTTFARTISDIPNRLKLATAAAISGDERSLDRQLERLEIEVPLAALIGRLASAAGGPLGRLPAGATGVVQQLAIPPDPDAWLIGLRLELAETCRYAMEREYARATGRAELTAQLDAYVNDRIRRLADAVPPAAEEAP